MLYEIFSFEAALEKTSVTDMMEMAWKTVPCSGSSMREAALSDQYKQSKYTDISKSSQVAFNE